MKEQLNSENTQSKGAAILKNIFQFVSLFFVLYIFLVALELMGASFKLFGSDFAKNLVATASNPFIGLFIGMLATAIIQSSSTTTSTVVALVASGAFGAAHDPETISLAVPIIMGANIGTSVTSTIVSLGHITQRAEYRKAIAAATVHDFFNIFTVLVVLPLELAFGLLSKPASYLAGYLFVGGGSSMGAMKILKMWVKPLSEGVIGIWTGVFEEASFLIPLLSLLSALVILFFSLRGLTTILKEVLIGRVLDKVDKTVFGNPFKAMGWGFGITTLVQSSSVTSSLSVPLVATGKISLQKAFPFLMGANIGTTTTALIASLFTATSENPIAGVAIALCHLFFNLFGVVVLFPIPYIRMIPIRMSRWLGRATLNNRLVGVFYILITFFLIPITIIVGDRMLNQKTSPSASENVKTEIIQSSQGLQSTPKDESVIISLN